MSEKSTSFKSQDVVELEKRLGKILRPHRIIIELHRPRTVSAEEIEVTAKEELGGNVVIAIHGRQAAVFEKRIARGSGASGATWIWQGLVVLVWYYENEPEQEIVFSPNIFVEDE